MSSHSLPPNSSGPRAVLAISTILISWLLMQVTHESGHVLAAILTGGEIRQVVLVPWELSRTDLIQNPHPLIVCWAGPMLGAIAPVGAWLIARSMCWSAAFWLRFLAGFCLIANGAYIAVGEFTHDGDAGDLLKYGSRGWTLWLFGAITVPIGFGLWHGLGKEFGFGPNVPPVGWRAASTSILVLVGIIVIEVILAQI